MSSVLNLDGSRLFLAGFGDRFKDTKKTVLSLTRLTLHRTYASILEEQPIVRLIPFAGTSRVRDLVLSIITLDQVLHNAARLE